ncbi:hypothetical protein [Gymnodinialimonas ulvae]|uniref:hypothetical protein n=1 Tax=Gymnodinialimonas ulvae TaxID=3126504 RepID=UPI0030B54295
MIYRALPLALGLTALAHPASAFGDLDCFAVETCTAGTCVADPAILPFPLEFDWAERTVALPYAGEVFTLESVATELSGSDHQGYLAFEDPADREHGPSLFLQFTGPSITATFDMGAGSQSHTARCAPQEAA